ncbi:hypothetical protein [Pedobacter gandavensis]|nr:hypothetical protein [Pedobacter gandavensis]
MIIEQKASPSSVPISVKVDSVNAKVQELDFPDLNDHFTFWLRNVRKGF